jgi:hypothetical protein
MLTDKMIADLQPDTPFSVDCFQNLVLILLHAFGTDICVFGSTWPWVFYKTSGPDSIIFKYFVSQRSIRDLAGYELIESDITGDINDFIVNEVKEHEIIVNVDQYYVKHHYPDIYLKTHGPHSLLLLRHDENKSAFYGMGVIPQFKGWFEKDEIVTGIESFPRDNAGYMKCYRLKKIQDWVMPTKDEIKNLFLESMVTDLSYENMEVLKLQDIFNTFEMIYTNKDVDYLNNITKERWFWEIDRLGHILTFYLSSDNYSPIVSVRDRQQMVSLINELSNKLVVSFRKIYKYQLTRNDATFEDGLRILKDVVTQIENLKNIVRKAI